MTSRRREPDDRKREGLHPGRDGLAHEQVSGIQRARMLSAMAEVASERGAGNVTVAHVVARSGVSRRTFYELFSGREDCFLAAFDDAITRIANEVIPAYEQPGRWRERMRAALTALLEVLDYEPGMGRLVIVETLGAGPNALERRSRVLAQVITAVDEGRLEAKRSDGPPPLTAEGVVGAVLGVLHGRVLACPRMGEKNPGRLIELTGPLMGMIVLPYLGPAAARRELDRPVPKMSNNPRRTLTDPLRELEMRLTYRTVRVLMAVAATPGSSNRTVADGAGIKDQGQISKLLARLQRLGLIENTGEGSARGGPNAWALTERGREVHGAITEQSTRS
jgi:AcrR family transcriptional regulator/DNA-binding MarR family transcriptional regulator